ncbi:MAG: RDD family protein [Rhizonema sp. NSF051]|nr:RDD family protein [Rhizonema sp. NSF051]
MHLFNRVKSRTPESVELEFTLAGIGNRAWALLIDYHVLGVILILFLIILLIVSSQLTNVLKAIFGNSVFTWLLAIASIISFGIYTGYFVFFETLWHGQTPGKRFAKIRVVRDDGRLIGLQQATLRALLRPFDEMLFIGALLIVFGRHEKRLGDLAAGTIVIQNQTPITSANLTISEEAKLASEQLLNIADLSAMLPDDFTIIREYLLRRGEMTSKAKALVSLQLVNQLLPIIKLEKIPYHLTPDVFLEAIYLVYQQSFT